MHKIQMNKCCGRANGDSANDLIINIRPLVVLIVLRKHYLLHYSLCLSLFSFIANSPCTSFPKPEVPLSFGLSSPVISSLLLWLYQLKWNASVIWVSLPLPEPQCWSGWKCLSIERHELASWIFPASGKRILHIEKATVSRIHQIIFHHLMG